MKRWLLFIAASTVFGSSLLAHLPARLVIPEKPGKFQFVGISGSLWRGEISKVLFSGKALPVQNLQWSVRPLALLTGNFKAEFNERWTPANRGIVGMRLYSRSIELQDLHWQASSKTFGAAVLLQGLKARGDLNLDLETLQFPADVFFPSKVEGRLDWQDAELQFDSQRWQIGSPVIQLSGDGSVINGRANNSQPMLPGEAAFQCTTGGCSINLSLRPSPGAPQSMLGGLLLAGLQQTGDTFSGQLDIPLE